MCVCVKVESYGNRGAVSELFTFYRYEKSYMHRDVVTHVAVSAAEFFITGSADGKPCSDCHFCNHIMFYDWLKLVINYENFCQLYVDYREL